MSSPFEKLCETLGITRTDLNTVFVEANNEILRLRRIQTESNIPASEKTTPPGGSNNVGKLQHT